MIDATYTQQLWRRRDFIRYLAAAGVQSANASTVLGLFWWVLGPLLLAGIYFFLFGKIFGNARDPEYFPYLLSGLFAFYYTRGTMVQGASAPVKAGKLITNINFPQLSLIIASTIESTFGFLASLVVYLGFAMALGHYPGPELLAFPAILIVHMLFNTGLAALTARTSVVVRDVGNLLPYATRIWLYTSPVIYTMDRVPESIRRFLEFNPLVPILDLYRWCFLGIPLRDWTIPAALGWTALALVVGITVFVRSEKTFTRYL